MPRAVVPMISVPKGLIFILMQSMTNKSFIGFCWDILQLSLRAYPWISQAGNKDQEFVQNDRARSILRPRAVLSSPGITFLSYKFTISLLFFPLCSFWN